MFFFWFIDRILKSKITVIITVVCLFAVTGILKFFDISLPYNFQLVPFWLAFMILGAFSAQIKLFFLPVKTGAKLAIGVGTLVTGVIIALIKPPASNLFRGSFGEKEVICLLLCTVAAITGVWGLSQIFALLEEAGLRMKELAWVGSHSLVFYIFHMFLAWIICVITKFNVLYKEPLEKGTIPKSIGLTAAVIVLCILRCLAEDFIKKKNILIAALIILAVVNFISISFAKRLTKPLHDLTEATKQAGQGDYEFKLDYDKDDEVGILTHAFKELTAHTQDHINDLNEKVYVDALTSVRNKRGYGAYIQNLQDQLDTSEESPQFAFGVFDCNNLKLINDNYGHDKGDAYLITASQFICRIFQHSPVFRIGGDEFAVILQNEDYQNMNDLLDSFKKSSKEISETAENKWDRVNVAIGVAVYDPELDSSIIDVARRADQLMYENKRRRKEKE